MTPQKTWRRLNVCCTLPAKVILPNINVLPKLKWTAQDFGHIEFAAVVGILQPVPNTVFLTFADRPITLAI
jgi:hypothetical protein